MRRHFLSLITASALMSSVLVAQAPTGHPISKTPFKSAIEYQSMIRGACNAPQFNVTCDELLVAWQGALPGKFTRILDVEQYLLTSVTEVRCPAGKLDVAGLAATPREIKFRVRDLDPTKWCLKDKNTGQIVALLDCGNPSRAVKSDSVVPPPPQQVSLKESELLRDTLKMVRDSLRNFKDNPARDLLTAYVYGDSLNLLSQESKDKNGRVVGRNSEQKILTYPRTQVSLSFAPRVKPDTVKVLVQPKHGWLTTKKVAVGGLTLVGVGAIICAVRSDHCGIGDGTQTQITNVNINRSVSMFGISFR